MPIRILPETVAAQIAAGEVVERPASVVKELIENSLDAGARVITVEVREGGRKLIRVSDDGSGIPAAEAEIAFYRHSTSKLSTAADLAAIQTLGFRGEALASIASVAQVTMVSRAAGEIAGVRLRVDGGHIHSTETVGAPQGTVIAVENLFFNVPARLEFLRSTVTEKRQINELVTRYALAYPTVRFRLVHDNRMVFQSSGNNSFQDVLVEVMGLDAFRQMIELVDSREPGETGTEVRPEIESIRVKGFTSAPPLSRSNRSQIILFVNGRWIQDRGLGYAVVQAYHTMLMIGRYPIAVIMIRIPPDRVDVNVHPTKAEVRFKDANLVFSAVQRAVRRTLIESLPEARPANLAPTVGSEEWIPVESRSLRTALSSLEPVSHFQPAMDLPASQAGERMPLDSGGEDSTPVPANQAGGKVLPVLRVVGQIGSSYILSEGPDGLVVIDQHAAHERILYEQYMAQRQTGVVTQSLLEATPVDLPLDTATYIEEYLDVLQKLGFDIEQFGGSSFLVRGLPALLGNINPKAALEAVAEDLEKGGKPLEQSIEEKIITRVCKTAAVKAGKSLTMQEMAAMIRQLEDCAAPFTCPHGRPTMIEMSAGQLAKLFGRV